jgi:glycosyltransferase involved in cell wall biosynthesis
MVLDDQPIPVRYGATHVVTALGRHLASRGHNVHLIFRSWRPITARIASQLDQYFTSFEPVYGYRHRLDAIEQAMWYVEAMFWQEYDAPHQAQDAIEPEVLPGAPSQVASGEMCPTDLRDAFALAVRRRRPDVVLLNYVWLTPLLDLLGEHRPVTVLYPHDVLHQRLESYATGGERENYHVTREEEIALMRRYDLVCPLQDIEGQYLRRFLPAQGVITTGVPFPLNRSEPCDDGRTVAMVASRATHNVHGGQHFLNSIWPSVVRACPQARLRIYGNICSALAGNTAENLELCGQVDDLADAYKSATIMVNPAYIGSGLKVKSVEALCNGRPLVTTPLGFAGLDDPRAAVVAETDGEFAQGINDLLTDPDRRERLSARALTFAATELAPQAVYQHFDEAVDRFIGTRRQGSGRWSGRPERALSSIPL